MAAPLKHLSNCWRSLEMPLIKCKIHLELSWTKNCVMSSVAGDTEFKIANTKLYVPIVTLSTEDNVKLTKQLSEGFKRFVCWNQYRMEIKTMKLESNNPLRIFLNASFQGVKRLSVLAFDDTKNGTKRVEKKQSQKILSPKSRHYQLQRINPLSANTTIWSNTLKQFVGNLPTNCLNVFDHFVKLALKGLTTIIFITICYL